MDRRGRVSIGARVLAFVLVAGGLLGMVATAIPGAVLFGWGIVTGVALWQGRSWGFRWATILFGLQVPVFSILHVTYEYSTFVSLRVMMGRTSHYLGGNIGSSSNVGWLAEAPGFLFGINLIAVLAVVYLLWADGGRRLTTGR